MAEQPATRPRRRAGRRFQASFIGAAAVALVGVLVALFVVRREDLVEQIEAVPALEAA